MALNKKDLNFFHFLARLPQKVGDPCPGVILLYFSQKQLPENIARAVYDN